MRVQPSEVTRLSPQEIEELLARAAEIEEENNRLANLYVASYQLHSTLDLAEVLRIIVEIVINLIGAERFAVHVLNERTQRLEPVAGDGAPLTHYPSWQLGEGEVGRAVAEGRVYHAPEGSADDEAPQVCIPLCVRDRVLGAIVIYRWLVQKQGVTRLDEDLFTLLAGHSATALLAARLYAESERKLSTIQGLLGLLTR